MLAIGRRKEPCYRTIKVCTITERAEGMSDDSVLQHNSRGDFMPPKKKRVGKSNCEYLLFDKSLANAVKL